MPEDKSFLERNIQFPEGNASNEWDIRRQEEIKKIMSVPLQKTYLGPQNTFQGTNLGAYKSSEAINKDAYKTWLAQQAEDYEIDMTDPDAGANLQDEYRFGSVPGTGRPQHTIDVRNARKIADAKVDQNRLEMGLSKMPTGPNGREPQWARYQEGGQHTPMGGMTSAFRGDWKKGNKK